MPREAFALLIVANIMNERQDQFPFNLSSFFTGKVPRSDQKMGRMRFIRHARGAKKNILVPDGDLRCMLSYYVNIHVESKCYEYYVKEKVTQGLGYHGYRCSYQASDHFIAGSASFKGGNAVFFLRRQGKRVFVSRIVNQERYDQFKSQLALTGVCR